MLTDEQRNKQNAAKRAKYHADPEVRRKIYETNKAWVEANKDRHRVACREAQRRYREKPGKKEYYAAKAREYRDRDPAAANAKNREWKRRNPEKCWQHHINKVQKRGPGIAALIEARARSKRRGIPFELSREWVEENYTGFCALSGLPFEYFRTATPQKLKIMKVAAPMAASLDRIDPAQGYVPGNCRFIVWALNRFKANDPDDLMLKIAAAMVDRARSLQQLE